MSPKAVRIGDVLELERIPVHIDLDATYDQIGIRSFGNGIFHREPCTGNDLSKLRYFEVRPGRLVVSNIMAWEGAIGVSTDAEKGSVGSATFLSYRAVGDADIRYLNYFFQTEEGRSMIRSASTGTVARNQTLSPGNFERVTLSLPDLEEQRRVANKIDDIVSMSGRIVRMPIGNNSTHEIAISGLDRIFERYASGSIRVDQVCTLVNDVVHPGDDPSPAVEFVGLEHIRRHFGIRIGSRPLGDEKGRKLRFASGDILYGYLRPYLNKVWLSDRAGLCSVEQYVLRPNGAMPGELIAAGLRSRSVLNQVLEATHSLQLPRLRSGLLMAMEIPYVSPGLHELISSDVTAFMSKVEELDGRQRYRDELLKVLRPVLLSAAFAGRL